MKARNLNAAIRRARRVYVWVNYSDDDGAWIQVAKWSAKLIVDQVRDTEIDVPAEEERDDLYIG